MIKHLLHRWPGRRGHHRRRSSRRNGLHLWHACGNADDERKCRPEAKVHSDGRSARRCVLLRGQQRSRRHSPAEPRASTGRPGRALAKRQGSRDVKGTLNDACSIAFRQPRARVGRRSAQTNRRSVEARRGWLREAHLGVACSLARANRPCPWRLKAPNPVRAALLKATTRRVVPGVAAAGCIVVSATAGKGRHSRQAGWQSRLPRLLPDLTCRPRAGMDYTPTRV